MILLIDGDEYLYKACAALEKEVQWDDQNHVLSCNAAEAWDVFTGSLDKLQNEIESQAIYLAFSGHGNFRKTLYPAYKEHRKKTRKPLCYSTLLERAFKTFKCHAVDGLEADDLLGIWATSGKFGDTLIVSSDKDMQTLPTAIYRDGEIRHISESEADMFWLTQTLTGDTSDGYPGCPSYGPVKAQKLLQEFWTDGVFHMEEAWEALVRAYESQQLTAEDALTQARLARILRSSDWDHVNKEVKLWTP